LVKVQLLVQLPYQRLLSQPPLPPLFQLAHRC
jgi:hypothetical protein